MFFSMILLCLLHWSTCLTGQVYDQELGLYWLNRVEAPLLNQIPCGYLICTASIDFLCWNCAFGIFICLFLDQDSMSAQFFQNRDYNSFVFGLLSISVGEIFQNHKLCKHFGLVSVLFVS